MAGERGRRYSAIIRTAVCADAEMLVANECEVEVEVAEGFDEKLCCFVRFALLLVLTFSATLPS